MPSSSANATSSASSPATLVAFDPSGLTGQHLVDALHKHNKTIYTNLPRKGPRALWQHHGELLENALHHIDKVYDLREPTAASERKAISTQLQLVRETLGKSSASAQAQAPAASAAQRKLVHRAPPPEAPRRAATNTTTRSTPQPSSSAVGQSSLATKRRLSTAASPPSKKTRTSHAHTSASRAGRKLADVKGKAKATGLKTALGKDDDAWVTDVDQGEADAETVEPVTAHPASNASHKTKIQSSAISVPWLDDPVVFSGQSLHNLGRASRELVDPIWLVFGSEQELAETIAYIVEGFQGDAQKAVLYDEEVAKRSNYYAIPCAVCFLLRVQCVPSQTKRCSTCAAYEGGHRCNRAKWVGETYAIWKAGKGFHISLTKQDRTVALQIEQARQPNEHSSVLMDVDDHVPCQPSGLPAAPTSIASDSDDDMPPPRPDVHDVPPAESNTPEPPSLSPNWQPQLRVRSLRQPQPFNASQDVDSMYELENLRLRFKPEHDSVESATRDLPRLLSDGLNHVYTSQQSFAACMQDEIRFADLCGRELVSVTERIAATCAGREDHRSEVAEALAWMEGLAEDEETCAAELDRTARTLEEVPNSPLCSEEAAGLRARAEALRTRAEELRQFSAHLRRLGAYVLETQNGLGARSGEVTAISDVLRDRVGQLRTCEVEMSKTLQDMFLLQMAAYPSPPKLAQSDEDED